MIGFPNAKINIGLRITGKLTSGYHEIKSLMFPVKFCDILEFIPSGNDSLKTTGIGIPGDPNDNILWKVLTALRKRFEVPPLKIHLHKNVPTGAGLGGGSSDASFFMNMLNDAFHLNLSFEERENMVAAIGSDCPFFIRNTPAMISGTGTTVKHFEINLDNMFIGIAFPGFRISTPEAYANVTVKREKIPLDVLLQKDISTWKDNVLNDFEESLFPKHDELRDIKDCFYKNGAVYASLSGSGSAVFGLFDEQPDLSADLEKKMIYQGFI